MLDSMMAHSRCIISDEGNERQTDQQSSQVHQRLLQSEKRIRIRSAAGCICKFCDAAKHMNVQLNTSYFERKAFSFLDPYQGEQILKLHLGHDKISSYCADVDE